MRRILETVLAVGFINIGDYTVVPFWVTIAGKLAGGIMLGSMAAKLAYLESRVKEI